MTENLLPETWRLVEIGELCLSVKNIHPSRLGSKDFKYVDISSIDNHSKQITGVQNLPVENSPSRARQILANGDVIVSTVRPGLNAVALVPKNLNGAIASTGFCVLRSNQDVIIPEFLFAWVRHPSFVKMLVRFERGIGFPAVRNSDVHQIQIPLPPLSEQQKIVEVLREADTLRQLRQQANQKASELLPSLFQFKFGDPIQNEKDWRLSSLSEIVSDECPITYGIVQPGMDVIDGVVLVRPIDLVNRVITSTGQLKRVEASIADKYPRSKLQGEELLLSVRGQIGAIAFADKSLAGGNVTRGIVPLWFGEDVLPEFVYAQLLHPSTQHLLQRMAIGIALKQVNLEELRKLRLIIPPIEIQEDFVDSSREYWSFDDSLTSSLNQIEEFAQSVIVQAFTGDLTPSFRKQNYSQLEKEALERDIALGEMRERRLTLDLDNAEHRDRLIQNIASQLPLTLMELHSIATDERSIIQQSFPALTQMVEEVSPALPDKEDRLFHLIDSLVQNVYHGLRQQFVEVMGKITQRILPFYQQDAETKAVLEMLLRSATNIKAIESYVPQASRTIRASEAQTSRIDGRLQTLLTVIEHRPPYFRAFDLVHPNFGLAEVTAGLRILESLGFIRRVVWETDLDAVFRLVDPSSPDDVIRRDNEAG